MMNNNTAPSAPITVSGTLVDSEMKNRPIGLAPVEFTDGTQRLLLRTDRNGYFEISLPAGSTWTLAPDSKPEHDTAYAFKPVQITASDADTNLGTLSAQGDSLANAQTLKNYVANVFAACQNIFAERIAAHDGSPLTEEMIKAEAACVARITQSALGHVIEGVTAPGDEPLCMGSAVTSQTAIPCSQCQALYANNPAALQNCLCCPKPCTN